jgi:hypothetical protein
LAAVPAAASREIQHESANFQREMMQHLVANGADAHYIPVALETS